MEKLKPTARQHECFQKRFDYLNQDLFQGRLPNFILSFTHLSKKTDGYFIPTFWAENEKKLKHGICIKPLLLIKQNKTAVLFTMHGAKAWEKPDLHLITQKWMICNLNPNALNF